MTQHPKEPREPDHWMYADTGVAEVVEQVARELYATSCALDPLDEERQPDWGRGGFKTEIVYWRGLARAAIAATPPRIPNGFVLVPEVPTPEMIWAYEECPYEGAEDKWSAMIAAAPQAPALPETGVE